MRLNLLGFMEVLCSLLDSLLSADYQAMSDYFVVSLQVISSFSSLDSRLGNQIIKATILTSEQEFTIQLVVQWVLNYPNSCVPLQSQHRSNK